MSAATEGEQSVNVVTTGNTTHSNTSTRHLIAAELLPGLKVLPDIQLSDVVLAAIRVGASRNERPPLSPMTPEQQTVQCEQRYIPGPEGAPDIRVLVYMPATAAAEPRPAYLHFHGGGYVLGMPEQNDSANRSLVASLGCVVVSVSYRLAPETPFPGALEDCYAALRWLHLQAGSLGVDRRRIAIGGVSAGAGHAAALAMLGRRRGEFPICFQMLDSPMIDDRTGSSSDPHPYCGEFVWTAHNNRFGWRALLGVEPGTDEVPAHAVPARATDLSGLPPVFLMVGTLDLFLEEGLEYVRRLIRAGVPTELHVIPGAYHGFGAIGPAAPQVRECLRLRNAAFARAFALA